MERCKHKSDGTGESWKRLVFLGQADKNFFDQYPNGLCKIQTKQQKGPVACNNPSCNETNCPIVLDATKIPS